MEIDRNSRNSMRRHRRKKKTGENICLKYCRGVKSEDWYETIGFSIRRTEISEKASSVKHLIWKPDFKELRGE